LRPQRLCLQGASHTRCCLKSSNRENRLAKPTAPLASGRLAALRIALISSVAWSCVAGFASSADAATRGMGAPYGWYDGWYAPPAAMPARKVRVAPKTTNTTTKKEKAEPRKKDPGFGQMPKGPLQIVVSIGNQKVTLFSNGVRVAQGPISTGVPGHPTPTGVFSIIEKDRYHHSNLYSNAPMPYMQRITWSGVALHEGVLPGYPASHGCIRMSHDFAQKLWPITNLGVRVIVAHHELAPVDFAHPKLFAPKLKPSEPAVAGGGTDGRDVVGTIVMAQAPVAEPGSAAIDTAPPAEAKPGSDATSDRESAEMTPPPAQMMEPDGDVVAAEAQPAQATETQPAQVSDEAKASGLAEFIQSMEVAAPVAPSDAGDAPEMPQTSEPAAPVPIVPAVGEPRPAEAAPGGDDVAKPAPTVDPAKPTAPPTKAADQPTKRSGQVAVFVSRKEQKIFVRQGFVPLFDMPIVIEQPDQPLGTHVFTAMEVTDNGSGMRWNLISVPTESAASTEQRDTRKKSKAAPTPAVWGKPPASAAQALDRIQMPAEAVDRIGEILTPGSSLVVSDEGLGRETGRYTEFIVLSR
jgi:lipoprotein-anchoring transpeptidase ErfK/SrfK